MNTRRILLMIMSSIIAYILRPCTKVS